MRLDRRPLLETAVDADLFVDRDRELNRILRALELGLNVALNGAVGSGRTSILRHLVLRLRNLGRPAFFLGASGATTSADLLHRVLRRVAGDEAAALAAYAALDADALIGRLVDALPTDGPRPVVVVDDVGVEPGRTLFGMLRDEVWRVPASWVVCAEGDTGALLRPPVDAFFEVTVELTPLEPRDVIELLRRRLDDPLPEADLHRLAELSDGSPRRAIDFAREVVLDGISVDELADAARDRADRLAGLSESGVTLVRMLESLGPVSPSDADLQRRMGVSRPRLVALFGELRDAGLVTELPPDRSSSGPGRPRVRYALASKNVGAVRDPADDDS